MPRLTINLTSDRHRALKEAAARQGKTIGQLVDESLELAGIKTRQSALQILAEARAQAGMSQAKALSVAVAETRAQRRSRGTTGRRRK